MNCEIAGGNASCEAPPVGRHQVWRLRLEHHHQWQGLLSLRRREGARQLRQPAFDSQRRAEAGDARGLKHGLLTQEHAELFVKEFKREMARLSAHSNRHSEKLEGRLPEIEGELTNLTQNLLAGLASPTFQRMISELEAEKARLATELAMQPTATTAAILRSFGALPTRWPTCTQRSMMKAFARRRPRR